MRSHRPSALVVILLLGLALALAACSTGESATPGTDATPPPPASSVDDEQMPKPPAGALEVGGVEYPLGLGSYCWSGPADDDDDEHRLAVCVDAIGVIANPEPTEAGPGGALVIAGDLASLEVVLHYAELWHAPDEPTAGGDGWEAWSPPPDEPVVLEFRNGAMLLPGDLAAGRYLLALHIGERGAEGNSASYGAIVEVR